MVTRRPPIQTFEKEPVTAGLDLDYILTPNPITYFSFRYHKCVAWGFHS